MDTLIESRQGQRLVEFIKNNLGLIGAITGGLTVSVLTSEKHSITGAIARLCAGLFCAVFLTDPFLHYLALDSETYRNAVAGLFSMTGYALTRFMANIDRTTVSIRRSFQLPTSR